MAQESHWLGRRPLRVGFVSPVDPLDPDRLSGMPFQMRRALESRGLEIVCCSAPPERSRAHTMPGRLRQRAPWLLREGWRTARHGLDRGLEHLQSRGRERGRLRAALHRAAALSERIQAAHPDVIFGCCISSMLFGLETDVPIVYFSDATARIINETYPTYARRGPGYKRVCDAYERATMQRISLGAFASECARQSAVEDYGLARDQSRVVPMGANITPQDLPGWREDQSLPPSRDDLQLCLIASDPLRKRAGLAVAIVELLAQRGWTVTLHHIGQADRALSRSRLVHSRGRLRLALPEDRTVMADTIARSHLMILPSVGEAFGIAPCEAAHFARPSVVSAAGGLSEVVIAGRTGLVLPIRASAADYVAAIESLAEDARLYAEMSAAALARACDRLNWCAWANGIVPLLVQAAESSPHLRAGSMNSTIESAPDHRKRELARL